MMLFGNRHDRIHQFVMVGNSLILVLGLLVIMCSLVYSHTV